MKHIGIKIRFIAGISAFLALSCALAGGGGGGGTDECYSANFGGLACYEGSGHCQWDAFYYQQSILCAIQCCYNANTGALIGKSFAGSDGTYLTACTVGPNGDCCTNLVSESDASTSIFNSVSCPASPGYPHL